jgi:hypothetical protein
LKEIGVAIGSATKEYYNNFQGGESEEGFITEQTANEIINAIFGSFIIILNVLGIVLDAISTIICPFLSVVTNLIDQVSDFITPIIIGAFANSDNGNTDVGRKDDGTLDIWFKLYIGIIGVSALISLVGGTPTAILIGSAIVGFLISIEHFKDQIEKLSGIILGVISLISSVCAYSIFRTIDIPDSGVNTVCLWFVLEFVIYAISFILGMQGVVNSVKKSPSALKRVIGVLVNLGGACSSATVGAKMIAEPPSYGYLSE